MYVSIYIYIYIYLYIDVRKYLYIFGKMEVNLMICKCTNMKKQGILRMILFLVELFAYVKYFDFILDLYQDILTYDDVSSELYLIFHFSNETKICECFDHSTSITGVLFQNCDALS